MGAQEAHSATRCNTEAMGESEDSAALVALFRYVQYVRRPIPNPLYRRRLRRRSAAPWRVPNNDLINIDWASPSILYSDATQRTQ